MNPLFYDYCAIGYIGLYQFSLGSSKLGNDKQTNTKSNNKVKDCLILIDKISIKDVLVVYSTHILFQH